MTEKETVMPADKNLIPHDATQKLTITIVGAQGSGKSMAAAAIAECLYDLGAGVTVLDENGLLGAERLSEIKEEVGERSFARPLGFAEITIVTKYPA